MKRPDRKHEDRVTDEPFAARGSERASVPQIAADIVLAALRPLVPVIAESFGRNCEVILHDLRTPEASVVAIAGRLTARRVGAPVNEISKWLLAQGRDVPERRNAFVRVARGRTLKSTAVLLRDAEGDAYGVFCINIDVTELGVLAALISDLAGTGSAPTGPLQLTDDIAHVVNTVVAAEEARLGIRLDARDRKDRLTIFAALEVKGALRLKRAVPRLAEHFGLSRATVYSDLKCLRDGTDQPA